MVYPYKKKKNAQAESQVKKKSNQTEPSNNYFSVIRDPLLQKKTNMRKPMQMVVLSYSLSITYYTWRWAFWTNFLRSSPLTFTAFLMKQYQRRDICLVPLLNSISSRNFCVIQPPMGEIAEETLWSSLNTWGGAIVNSKRHRYQVHPKAASGCTAPTT